MVNVSDRILMADDIGHHHVDAGSFHQFGLVLGCRANLAPDTPQSADDLLVAQAMQLPNREGIQVDTADIFFARSADYGESWDSIFAVGQNPTDIEEDELPKEFRVPLNDDNDAQIATGSTRDEVISGQALPRLAVDEKGNIGVIWYDTRRDPADHLLDVFGTISKDGGQTFSPNFRVTDVSFDADQVSSQPLAAV